MASGFSRKAAEALSRKIELGELMRQTAALTAFVVLLAPSLSTLGTVPSRIK